MQVWMYGSKSHRNGVLTSGSDIVDKVSHSQSLQGINIAPIDPPPPPPPSPDTPVIIIIVSRNEMRFDRGDRKTSCWT